MNNWNKLARSSRIVYLIAWGSVVLGFGDLLLRDTPIPKFLLGEWIFIAAVWMSCGFRMDTRMIVVQELIDELRARLKHE